MIQRCKYHMTFKCYDFLNPSFKLHSLEEMKYNYFYFHVIYLDIFSRNSSEVSRDTRWWFVHDSETTCNGAVFSAVLQIFILSEHDLGYQLSRWYDLYKTPRTVMRSRSFVFKRNCYESISSIPFIFHTSLHSFLINSTFILRYIFI